MNRSSHILLTGGRAPVAVDLGRMLAKQGYTVHVADSLRYYMSQGSNIFASSSVISPPSRNLNHFAADLNGIIKEKGIDVIIPTCEEVLYLAKIRGQLPEGIECFFDDFDKLLGLHSKHDFINFCQIHRFAIKAPRTKLVKNLQEIIDFQKEVGDIIIKATYSRFSSNIYIKPSMEDLKKIAFQDSNPWLAQEYINGTEYASYSIAKHGQVIATSVYTPEYRMGLASATFFRPKLHPKVEAFTKQIVAKLGYHGHIAFDFIEKGDDLFVIECNPRMNSGFHLIADKLDFSQVLTSQQLTPFIIKSESQRAKKFAAMMPFCLGDQKRSTKKILEDFSNSEDVLWQRSDPLPIIWALWTYLFYFIKSLFSGTTLHYECSHDSEWNGDY